MKSWDLSSFETTVSAQPGPDEGAQAQASQQQGPRLESAVRSAADGSPPSRGRAKPVLHKARRMAAEDFARFQVARFVLAGRPLPPITDAVKIGEIFRRALMSRVAPPVPAVLSGRDEEGNPLRDPRHAHAFFLPEDHDQDGCIDHLVLYARSGLEDSVRRAAEDLRVLWIADSRMGRASIGGAEAHREWRVALEGFGACEEFSDSGLLRPSRSWVSSTPYLRPRHVKGGDLLEEAQAMIGAECVHRGWPVPEIVRDGTDASAGSAIRVGGQLCSVLSFHRFRSRPGLVQPDRTGLSLRLRFPQDIAGPVALGFGCHFGLGLFSAVRL